jgi:hypothetical protein
VTLSAGSIIEKIARWEQGIWSPLSLDEGTYLTFNPSGLAELNAGGDAFAPKTITHIDGNRLSVLWRHSQAAWAFDVSDNPGTNFYIEEWVSEQRDYAAFYNGAPPPAGLPNKAPTQCNQTYPDSPQPGTNTQTTTGLGAGTNAAQWFATCFDFYTADYFDTVKNNLALTGVLADLPGANFLDATLAQPLLVVPLPTACAGPQITTLGQSHCNWAVDALGGHSMDDVFAPSGVLLNSWTKTYGAAVLGGKTQTSGTSAQAGQAQQLKLTLNRQGNGRSGTGTLSSPFGAWSDASTSPTQEPITWTISPTSANMVLISWPFRDAGDPRVKANLASNGNPSPNAPVLPGGHFTASFNGNTFTPTPSIHTASNLRALAIVLQDGHFLTGQHYAAGYTYSERRFTEPALAQGMQALDHVLRKVYAAGFGDAVE